MKNLRKYVCGAALCAALLGFGRTASAQLLPNSYLNIDWQMNVPLGASFADKASGWGMNFEGGYFVTPRIAVGGFISYQTNLETIPRQTLDLGNGSALTTKQKHAVFQLPFGVTGRYCRCQSVDSRGCRGDPLRCPAADAQVFCQFLARNAEAVAVEFPESYFPAVVVERQAVAVDGHLGAQRIGVVGSGVVGRDRYAARRILDDDCARKLPVAVVARHRAAHGAPVDQRAGLPVAKRLEIGDRTRRLRRLVVVDAGRPVASRRRDDERRQKTPEKHASAEPLSYFL